MRASSQMLAYEITLGATLLGIVMIYGTIDLQDIVRKQGELLWGWIPMWGFVVQPAGLFLFLAAGIAETKRIPYDVPEGESEIIGYFTEYSGMKFGMFYFTDFIETILIAALTTTLFFGGWQIPYLHRGGFYFPWVEGGNALALQLPHTLVSILQMGAFTLKVVFFCWLFMTIRWTLPRFRYDQLMHLGWKIIFPISILNLLVTAAVLLLWI
jgi:NADH-quinone oxidoreductase subunit H